MQARIRVLSIDDSSVARENYRQIFGSTAGIELVGTAFNADIGRKKLKSLDPDVVILDIDMPGTDGLTFLKWLMRSMPTPVVISSTLEPNARERTMSALALGAIDVVCKGEAVAGDGNWGEEFRERLLRAVRAAAKAKDRMRRQSSLDIPSPAALVGPSYSSPGSKTALLALPSQEYLPGSVVVIGASTGGTEAIAHLVAAMPPNFPPTVIVQHMPPLYTESFAVRLDQLGQVHVREARGGEPLESGKVLVAPGGQHIRIRNGTGNPIVTVFSGPLVSGHRPSIDVLFKSAAEELGSRVAGVLLTGMGADGAEGLLEIRRKSDLTIAQDESTSVVYGMPKEAVEIGAARMVLPLGKIMNQLMVWLRDRGAQSRVGMG